MDPMLYVIAFDAMQRQLDDNARLRLRQRRAEVAERRGGLRGAGRRLRVALAAAAARLPRRTPLAAADGPVCCPA